MEKEDPHSEIAQLKRLREEIKAYKCNCGEEGCQECIARNRAQYNINYIERTPEGRAFVQKEIEEFRNRPRPPVPPGFDDSIPF